MSDAPPQLRPATEDLRTTWDAVWRGRRGRRSPLALWRRAGGRDCIHRLGLGVVRRELAGAAGAPPGAPVLEAGSGSGLISLELARRGGRVLLLDLSPEALGLARETFREHGLSPELVAARAESLPFATGSCGAAWSAGVLEHVPEPLRLAALREMFRVVRPGGAVFVMHPSAAARAYRYGKAWADRRGTWQAGGEEPIHSMLHLFREIPEAVEIREYSVGWLAQFHFLKYLFWRVKPLYYGWALLIEALHLPLGWLNRRPGYQVVTAGRRGPAARPAPAIT